MWGGGVQGYDYIIKKGGSSGNDFVIMGGGSKINKHIITYYVNAPHAISFAITLCICKNEDKTYVWFFLKKHIIFFYMIILMHFK